MIRTAAFGLIACSAIALTAAPAAGQIQGNPQTLPQVGSAGPPRSALKPAHVHAKHKLHKKRHHRAAAKKPEAKPAEAPQPEPKSQ